MPFSNDDAYHFSDLVDVTAFSRLLDNFYQATGIPNGVVDANGELLCMSSGDNACAVFHRSHPVATERCRDSNLELVRDLRDGCVAGGLCKNGLMDYATPVVIEGRQLATLFLGQILHTPPDEDYFRAQAERLGFDEQAYLASIAAIPVVDKVRVDDLMRIMVEMAQMLAASGLARLRQTKLERDVNHHSERHIQLKDILDFAPVAMCWSENEAHIEYVNRQFTQLFGYTLDDLPTLETWYQRAYPDVDYRETVVGSWRKAVAAARQGDALPPELEADITCKDGSVRSVIVRAAWIGQRRMVSFTDITERKRAEAALRESEAKLQGLYAMSPLGIALTNMEGGYLEFNEAFQRICGYTKEELNQLDYWALTPKEYAEQEAAQLESLNTRGFYGPYEKEYIQKSGRRIPLRLNGLIIRDHAGVPFIWSIVEDVTERKQAEDELRRREEEFRVLVENSPDVVVRFDRELRRTYISPQWEKVNGIAIADALGKRPSELATVVSASAQAFEAELRRTLESGQPNEIEIGGNDHEGEWKYFALRVVPELDAEGAVASLLTVANDVTERKRMEDALRVSEAQSRDHDRLLQAVLESSPEIIVFVLDRNYRYLAFNDKHRATMSAIWGKEIAVGMNMLDVIGAHPDREKAKQGFDRAMTGEAFVTEDAYGDEALLRLYWLNYFAPIRGEDGSTIGLTCFVLDISERRRSELRMQAHDAMLEMLAQDADLSSILDALVKYVESEDAGSMCSIMLADAEVKHLFSSSGPTLPDFYLEAINGIEIAIGVGSCCTAAALGERVVVEDIMDHEYWKPYRPLAEKAGLHACWSEPILSSKGKVLGTFATYHAQPQSPTAEDLERIAFATNLAAIAIENRQVREELERQAHSDYLTGLDNRRQFMGQAESELARTLRYERQLSILMLDIDRFKQINDTYGHKVGDLVLQRLAAVCRATLRNIDIIGRIGGEEFAVLLPEACSDQAMDAAERLRAALAAAELRLDSGLSLHFTVSIGVVTLADDGANLDTLLNQADRALYRAKRAGRDQVCLFEAGSDRKAASAEGVYLSGR
jgi:diguanylate cyclase (GGDEF)-like protein/PAS domain S-box-containing protein